MSRKALFTLVFAVTLIAVASQHAEGQIFRRANAGYGYYPAYQGRLTATPYGYNQPSSCTCQSQAYGQAQPNLPYQYQAAQNSMRVTMPNQANVYQTQPATQLRAGTRYSVFYDPQTGRTVLRPVSPTPSPNAQALGNVTNSQSDIAGQTPNVSNPQPVQQTFTAIQPATPSAPAEAKVAPVLTAPQPVVDSTPALSPPVTNVAPAVAAEVEPTPTAPAPKTSEPEPRKGTFSILEKNDGN
ncbi:MAG: hypothetical protein AAFN77_22190 [Planctomycetota bacterium]